MYLSLRKATATEPKKKTEQQQGSEEKEEALSLFLSLFPSISLPMWVRHAVGIALLERLSKQ